MFQSFSKPFRRTSIRSSLIVFQFDFFGSIMDENNFPDVKYFLNSKGNRQLIDSQNYVYCWNRGPKDDTRDVRSYWRCDQYLICKSYATVLNGKIISVKPHEKHGSDLAGLQAKLQEVDALKLAKENPHVRPRQILAGLANQNVSLATRLARRPEASLTRSIQRVRALVREEPNVPKSFAEILQMEIPEKYVQKPTGEPFMIKKAMVSENSDKGFLM